MRDIGYKPTHTQDVHCEGSDTIGWKWTAVLGRPESTRRSRRRQQLPQWRTYSTAPGPCRQREEAARCHAAINLIAGDIVKEGEDDIGGQTREEGLGKATPGLSPGEAEGGVPDLGMGMGWTLCQELRKGPLWGCWQCLEGAQNLNQEVERSLQAGGDVFGVEATTKRGMAVMLVAFRWKIRA